MAYQFYELFKLLGECVQASAEARYAEWFGQISKTFHNEQSTLVVIVEVHGRDYCHEKYFSIGNTSQIMGLVTQVTKGILDDAKSRYNLDIVQLVVPPERLGLATPF